MLILLVCSVLVVFSVGWGIEYEDVGVFGFDMFWIELGWIEFIGVVLGLGILLIGVFGCCIELIGVFGFCIVLELIGVFGFWIELIGVLGFWIEEFIGVLGLDIEFDIGVLGFDIVEEVSIVCFGFFILKKLLFVYWFLKDLVFKLWLVFFVYLYWDGFLLIGGFLLFLFVL